MLNMKNSFLLSVTTLLVVSQGFVFTPVGRSTRYGMTPSNSMIFSRQQPGLEPLIQILEAEEGQQDRGWINSRVTSVYVGLISGLCGYVGRGMAEDMEYAELPPPYVPALFGVALLAGIGILTASLGDVMTEEANLGLQSGARAKKEIERSRSSYFKRR